jgi:hypothetical protein
LRTPPRPIGLSVLAFKALSFLVTLAFLPQPAPSAARPQAQVSSQRILHTSARARGVAVRPEAEGPTMTGKDLLRALDLGDPADTIIARIRRNHTSFKNLDEISAGLHSHESSANAAALAQIWQEVSSSVWRNGAPLDSQQAATPPQAPSAAPSAPTPQSPAAPARLQAPAAANVAVPAVQQTAPAPPQAATMLPATDPPPAQSSTTNKADDFEITPAVVRVSEQAIEVSEQASASVTIKNYNEAPVRLGVAKVCLHEDDENGCLAQGEIFQVADGVDKCKNPLANKEQCTLKILFTPHRSFNYNQWLKVPLVDGGGQPLKKADGTPEALMIPLQGTGYVADMARVEATKANANNPALRSVVGLDIGGATATDTQQKLFVDFGLSAPLGLHGYTVCSDNEGETLTNKRGVVLPKTRFAGNIAAIKRVSGTVTALTKSAHNLVVGDRVLIAGTSDRTFEGEFEVATVPDPTHFSYVQTGSDSTGKDGRGTVSKSRASVSTIVGIARDENVVTVTTQTQHFFRPGDLVVIDTATESAASIHGTFVVSALDRGDQTRFMFAQAGTNVLETPISGTASLYDKFPAGSIVRSYEDCQELRTARERKNYVRYPWKDQHADPLDSSLWWFFNPRITSIPQPASALSSLNVQGFTDIFSAKQTNIVQGVDVQGGIEVMIVKPRAGRAFYGSFKNTKARLGLAWVLGGGFASPFAAPGTNPTVFTLDPKSPLRHQFQASGTLLCGATSPCDIPASFTNITFVNPERSRFFRKYYSGLRMKTYHFSKSYQSSDCDPGYKNECEGVYNAFPGILDLTVGQDEQVSGGHLSRWLLRLDVSYPLPFLPGTYAFGGVNSAFKKNQNTDPVFLPGTSTTAISDPSVFQVKVPLRDRDNYRLGIGVDLLQVITQAKQGNNKNPAGAGTTPPTPTSPVSAKQN